MALALILDIQNLNPGHIHYVNQGKPLKLSFIFLSYKMEVVIIIIKLHNSLYPTPLGPSVFRNSEVRVPQTLYYLQNLGSTTWPSTLTLQQKVDDHSHEAFNFVFCCCCLKSTYCTNPGQIFQPNQFATNLKMKTFIFQSFGTRLVRLKAP